METSTVRPLSIITNFIILKLLLELSFNFILPVQYLACDVYQVQLLFKYWSGTN